jgi:hypothetical protein
MSYPGPQFKEQSMGKEKELKKESGCHFIYHKSHIKSPGFEPEAPG